MRVQLEVLSGPMDGHVFQFNHSVELGRETRVALPLDRFCSRRHALLEVDPPHVRLRDLGSTNGTYVEGSRVTEPVELTPGQVFRVGKTWLEISW